MSDLNQHFSDVKGTETMNILWIKRVNLKVSLLTKNAACLTGMLHCVVKRLLNNCAITLNYFRKIQYEFVDNLNSVVITQYDKGTCDLYIHI